MTRASATNARIELDNAGIRFCRIERTRIRRSARLDESLGVARLEASSFEVLNLGLHMEAIGRYDHLIGSDDRFAEPPQRGHHGCRNW